MNSSSPRIYGLIGYPVKHSLSPAMHNAAFRALKINAEYRLFEVRPEELEEFLLNPNKIFKDTDNNSIRAGDVLGFNITIPHKIKAREILRREFPFDENAPLIAQVLHYVKASGAINTVKRNKGGLKYFNTDAPGFIKSLKKDLEFITSNKNVLVIGCGGAGRAVIAGLSWKQHQVNTIFVNDLSNKAMDSAKRHFSQFPYIIDRVKFVTSRQIDEVIKTCQLLVNASPVGMKNDDRQVIDKNLLHQRLSVYDLVYNKGKTQLIKDAQSLNLPAVGGLGMLLYQGADAFEIWTEKRAPVDLMHQALQGGLKDARGNN